MAGCTTDINYTPVTTTFTVTGEATPTPTLTPTPTPTPTSTPTELIILVLNGTFEFPEAEGPCNDGTLYRDPSAAVSGTLVLTVDYTTGQASATLQGTGQATITICDHPTKTITRTIKGATLHGTINPSTNTLTMTGDVAYDDWDTCRVVDLTRGGACYAGGETQTVNITLNGIIDPAHSTGAGQIKWTGLDDWGVWQAP